MKGLVNYLMGMMLLACGVFSATPVHGQVPESNPYPFHVVASVASYSYFVFYPGAGPSLRVAAPWALAVGYRATDRLSFHLGYGLARHSDDHTVTGTTSTGRPTSVLFRDEGRDAVLPATVQYVLFSTRRNNLQLHGTAGLLFASSTYATRIIRTEDGVVTQDVRGGGRKSGFYTVLGTGVDYRFSRRLGATGELSWSRNLNAVSNATYRSLGAWNGFTRNVSLGLYYRFKLQKDVAITN